MLEAQGAKYQGEEVGGYKVHLVPTPPIPALRRGWGFTVHQGGVVPEDLDLAGVPHHACLIPVGQRGQMGQIPPQTAPTKPEGFRTQFELQSLNKFGIAALQPQIYGGVSGQRMAPAGGNAPRDGGTR